jgi:hypothetical protein
MFLKVKFIRLCIFGFLFTFTLLGCQKSLIVSPLNLNTPNYPVIPNGIYWRDAEIVHGKSINGNTTSNEYFYAVIEIAVNQKPETTIGVTLSGPGGSAPLTYSGEADCKGYRYSSFESGPITFPYLTGNYVLTTNTSIGVASVTIIGPGDIKVSPDGSQTSWAVEGNHDKISVIDPSRNCVFSSAGNDINSPVSIPVSVYSTSSGEYIVVTHCENDVSTINNGAGYVYLINELGTTISK